MEKQSTSWVFPTVKNLVSLLYYFVLVALLGFTLMSSLKLLGAQLKNVPFGEDPPTYVSVPVAWAPASTKILPSSSEPHIYLKPQKQIGQLKVPIRSTSGFLMILLGLVGLVTATWTFFLLRRIFQSAQVQTPFQADNARRINQMGFLFLGQTLIELLLKLALWSQTRAYFQQMRLDHQTYLNIDITLDGPWLLGLILLALSQVFRRGIELQLEHELTI